MDMFIVAAVLWGKCVWLTIRTVPIRTEDG